MAYLPVVAADPLARFLLTTSQFRRPTGRVIHTAFMPPPDLKLSVFLTRELADADIWAMGEENVATPRGKTMYGHAALSVSHVTGEGLQLEVDDTPPRHANVTAWPAEKPKQKLLAQKLAGQASLHLKPAETAESD